MKKVFTAFALATLLGTNFVSADNIKTTKDSISTTENDMSSIDVKDLPKAVRKTLAKYYKGVIIKSISVETNDKGTAIYQIIMTDAVKNNIMINFNEKGKRT